jgi:molybdopterin-guanine dinucleotide biosynthesis protein A
MVFPSPEPLAPSPSFGGVVLCGGRSTRMGLDKASLPFGPELMLPRVVRLLSQVVSPIVVVAAPGQELPPLPAGVIVTRDEREGRGPLEGLLAGLTAIAPHADAAYATSCDVPLLVPDFVRMMIARVGSAGSAEPVGEATSASNAGPAGPAGPTIAVPVEGQFHHPLAAVYRTSVIPVIAELLAADRLRPMFLFERVPTCRVSVSELTTVDPRLSTLANLNRPEDYLAALAEAGFAADPEVLRRLTSGD